MRRRLKPLSVKIEPELHAKLPELSAAHSHATAGEIIRRLLWQEIERLALGDRSDAAPIRNRRRYTT